MFPANGIYIPRKCSKSGKLIKPKEHNSAQISIAIIEEGKCTSGKLEIFTFSGKIRKRGQSDKAINSFFNNDFQIILVD